MDENENKNISDSNKVDTGDIDAVLKVFGNAKKRPDAPKITDETINISAVGGSASSQDANDGKTRVNFDAVKPEKASPASSANNATSSFSAISLDDFNTASSRSGSKKSKSSKKTSHHAKDSGSEIETDDVKVSFLGSAKFGVIKIIVYIAFVALAVWFISKTVINVGNDLFAFVKKNEEITVIIPENADTELVADILSKAHVINYPFVFEKYADFRISKRAYLTGKYLSGPQTVNPSMNYDQLLDALSDYPRTVKGTVRITIPEGLTVNETLDLLVEKGVGKKENYLEALQEFDYEYDFMKHLNKDELSPYRFDSNYSYRLEGYLFPDTYDFYLSENPISVIDKFLTNFNRKFEEDFYSRCDQLGMTVDEVITLASLIEKEGNNASDYYYISSVFHNRLNNSSKFPYLNSDAAIQYAMPERKGLYDIDTSLDHPYNTYLNRGLPPGPICNPSMEAIYAALYPEKTTYYYFYTKKDGETVFSRTAEEHQRYINADKAKSQ
ncbi:MAG: endolytic transglycosylase MltG [Clostridiales bacterium]|nr:endolytic transglycosylase MltG [Clostridiales bacterium]